MATTTHHGERPRDVAGDERVGQLGKLEAVGRLAGGVAHDFNNLLTVILGCSEMLLNKRDHNDETRWLLEEINKAGEKAASLTRQLLLFSRKQNVQPVVLNMNHVITELVKMVRRLLNEDIKLTIHLEETLHSVKVDQSQLEQVLLNLIINARDAMPRGGELRIETRSVIVNAATANLRPNVPIGSYATVTVRDTGCGMTPEVLSHLFEPFFTTKPTGKGTGLGLATVYGIIKKSDGYIDVASEVGCGSRFRVYLPVVNDTVSFPTGVVSRAAHGTSNETILLVEDDHALRTMAEHTLRADGFKVLQATNGVEALAVAEKYLGAIDLLLTDVVMPFMTGPQLATEMSRRRPEAKILFMSGYTDSLLAAYDEENIHKAFLEKPFSSAELVGAVRKMLAV
jgi:nitrogen-specific signal transduction histidine kinase